MADVLPPYENPMLRISNSLPISICVYWVDQQFRRVLPGSQESIPGRPLGLFVVQAGMTTMLPLFMTGTYLATCELTGSFVCVFTLEQTDAFRETNIGHDRLTRPNSFSFPVPDQFCIIPGDSPRVLVAAGKAANGKCIVREQYWHLSPESFVLAPNATHTISQTRVSGTLETTSKQETVSESLDLSVSGGWGPISASLSASLGHESTINQQVTVSSTDTRYEEVVHTNPTSVTRAYFVWQLVDQVSIIASQPSAPGASAIAATVASAQTPSLVAGPY